MPGQVGDVVVTQKRRFYAGKLEPNTQVFSQMRKILLKKNMDFCKDFGGWAEGKSSFFGCYEVFCARKCASVKMGKAKMHRN